MTSSDFDFLGVLWEVSEVEQNFEFSSYADRQHFSLHARLYLQQPCVYTGNALLPSLRKNKSALFDWGKIKNDAMRCGPE